MAALAIAGAGLAVAARSRGSKTTEKTRHADLARSTRVWVDVCHWTVRFPDAEAEAAAMADLPRVDDIDAILATMPPDARVEWSPRGASTDVQPAEIVRLLRGAITQELSEGKVAIAGGWVLARTEWNLMRLAASQGVIAGHAP
jgi:hypothetical protein